MQESPASCSPATIGVSSLLSRKVSICTDRKPLPPSLPVSPTTKDDHERATPNPETHIALFQRKEVRRTIHNNEWWFVIADVIAALTDSVDPQGYIKDMRRRDSELAKGWGQIATPLVVTTTGGPQELNCANTEGPFRLIQSIPSPKAEPFKRWLAKVGYERVQEIENPELAAKRTRAIYKDKVYSDG